MTFIPSPQQNDFFGWIQNGQGSCVLEAVAGSGKTTTLIEALKIMEGSIFFGAYNKKIADEIKMRAPQRQGLSIGTMHSAGFSIWKKVAGNVVVDGYKCRNIYRSLYHEYDHRKLESPVCNLVSYAKQAAIGAVVPNEDGAWYNLIEHFNLDCLEQDAAVIDMAKTVFRVSVEQDYKIVDFDDMILAPLIHHAKAYQYDWVLIDEAQDTNASRRALALLMLKRGGRLVAVGDRHQAIYGFTGADADALDLIGKAVDAIQMPLTVTYRCPKAVVAKANTWVKHIHAHPSAPEGKVEHFQGDLLTSCKAGDVILSRFTKHLMELVYKFIGAGVAAKVEGREIGNNMKVLVNRYKSKNFSVLIDRLDAYRERESAKYRMKEKDSMAAAVEDKVDCIKVIINRLVKVNPKCTTPVEAVCAEIDSIFGDDVKGCIILSTIHKSKGREWTNVYWLQTGASKWARMDWEKEQEKNLMYVAATRAKENLYLVPLDGRGEQKEATEIEIEVNYDHGYEVQVVTANGVLTKEQMQEIVGFKPDINFNALPEQLDFNIYSHPTCGIPEPKSKKRGRPRKEK